MMDVDDLIEQSRHLLEQEDYTQAKACLRKAAELAPLRNDLRDMLTYAIEQETIVTRMEAKRTGKIRPKRRQTGTAKPSMARRIFWSLVWIALSLGCLALGIFLVNNREALTKLVGSKKTRTTTTPVPTEIASPTQTPEPAATPVPTPQIDPLETQRHELLADAVALANLGKYEEAILKIEALLATAPPDATDYRIRLGIYHFRIGEAAELARDYDKAMAEFELAVKENPTKAEYYSHLGYIHYRKGCLLSETDAQRTSYFEKARSLLSTAIRLDPDYLRTYSTLALTHIKLLDKNSALECYKQVINRAGEGSPEALQAAKQMEMIQ